MTRLAPGWTQAEDFPVLECLQSLLDEECEHRQHAERDLAVLKSKLAATQEKE